MTYVFSMQEVACSVCSCASQLHVFSHDSSLLTWDQLHASRTVAILTAPLQLRYIPISEPKTMETNGKEK
jgi:hypothetical protein